MNATEFFIGQHEAAEVKAQASIHVDLEQGKRSALRLLDDFFQRKIDPDVHFEDEVLVFPDGLRLAFHTEHGPAFSSPTSFFRVQGQCPHCGEACWSMPCYSAGKVGEMLAGFVSQNHRCPVPAEKRPIGVGDVVSVELGPGDGVMLMDAEVLTTPRDGGGCWQFACDSEVYAVSPGTLFLITRTDKSVE